VFHEAHRNSFWQNLPFSGAWGRVQDFRARLLKIRDEAKKEKKLILMDFYNNL
jgi:hypothetical protein